MTAFSASVIVLYVFGYKERVEREIKLVAARALMPSALSEMWQKSFYIEVFCTHGVGK